jgi:hypothetical protein
MTPSSRVGSLQRSDITYDISTNLLDSHPEDGGSSFLRIVAAKLHGVITYNITILTVPSRLACWHVCSFFRCSAPHALLFPYGKVDITYRVIIDTEVNSSELNLVILPPQKGGTR